MPRAARRACSHALNHGQARDIACHDDADRPVFLRLLGRYRERFGMCLYLTFLLDNHFHLLMHLQDAQGLSSFMAGLLQAYWHHYRRRHGRVGPLFQSRFKSPVVEEETYLWSHGRSIERNPLKAGLSILP